MDKIHQNKDSDYGRSIANDSSEATSFDVGATLSPPALQFKSEPSSEKEEAKEDNTSTETTYQLAAEGIDPHSENPNDTSGDQGKPNNTGLPTQLKSGVENLSGFSLDDVKVHYNSDKPAQLQAHAYAQGTDIHVASGQEKHLPHEAWHVVQQKQGRVQATTQMKGIGVNDDSGLEKEADVMGAKAINYKTEKKQDNTSLSTLNTNTPIQRKLILLVNGSRRKFEKEKHGQNQMNNIIAQNNVDKNWQKYFMEDQEYWYDPDKDVPYAKCDNANVPYGDVETLQSDEMLKEAAGFAGAGAMGGGFVGAHVGSGVGSYVGSWIGLPNLGSYVGGGLGALGGAATGAVAGGMMNLDVPSFVDAKASEILWSMGIVTQGVKIDLGPWDVAKFVAGAEINFSPQLNSIKKHLKHEGSEILMENFRSNFIMKWAKIQEVDFKIPTISSAIEINLNDPNSNTRILQVKGNLNVTNLEIGANLDKSLIGILWSLIRNGKVKTQEDVIAAIKTNLDCENITAGLNIQTFAVPGSKGRKEDLGDDNFSASLEVDQLGLENTGLESDETSGQLGNLSAEVSRQGGKKEAKASVNASGAFSDLPSLREAVKENASSVKGLKLGNKLASGMVSSSLTDALADRPKQEHMEVVHKEIEKHQGGINIAKLTTNLPGGYKEHYVKTICKQLLADGRLKVHNTNKLRQGVKKLAGKGSKPKYSAQEPTNALDTISSIGKKTGQIGTKGVASTLKKGGLDVNIHGTSGDGQGQTNAAMDIDVHVDKELVRKGYKLLELTSTIVEVTK